ncbi:MAG TPA: polyphosphate kinase 1 [Gaiellaceae bacterium]|nr:polyphosphate kinase 1 [Gaiellaceae bacterium]
MAPAEAALLTDDARLLNRELSWLDYDARVLARASDPALPLLERSRNCAYFSSNLDEFFQVRVAGLMGQEEAGLLVRSPDGRTAPETLAAIREKTLELTAAQAKLWKRELRPGLADTGVIVGEVDDCNRKELDELEQRFERDIFPILTPLAVGPGQPFPYISPLSLSLGTFVRDPDSGEERFARVKVPELLPRFFSIGSRGLFLPLERVIRHFLPRLFPGMEIVECCTFRVTRDADFEVSDEADDLLEAVQDELRRRRFGDVVRVEVSGSVSDRMLERLEHGLRAGTEQIYLIPGLLDLAELQELVSIDRPDLKDEPWYPVVHPRFLAAAGADELFAEIRRSDILVHHPFDSFASSYEAFLKAAARDPAVVALKTALYRTSADSPVVPALVDAAERGKQSLSLIELKARFDESRNIGWSRSLEQAGVHVVYGFPNLKIHAKMTLIVRREGGELRRYVHLGTGNYNIMTAKTYEDYGLFTADADISADVADLFNYLSGFSRPQPFRKLLVAPFGLRDGLVERIREVRRAAANGKEARIRIKVNSLNDEELIEELYRASQEGAKIDIVARSICTLRPGVPGLSETIRVRSIVGRFLEHSRIFIFEAGQKRGILIGSSDLMPRNLDHRIEVLTPVEDGRAQQELVRAFDVLLADNASAWELSSEGRWMKLRPKKGDRGRQAQQVFMRSARARARRRAASLRTR